MENKKNQLRILRIQISKNVKTMVDIRILEGTRHLRIFPYEKIGHTVYEGFPTNLFS